MDSPSYVFVYDEALSERRCEREVAALETRLTTLGVTGRTIKLAMFRSAKETIESMVKHGVTTVVIVGDDRTLDTMMWFLPAMNIVLGYLPILGPSQIAKPLGIPLGVLACDVLAARLIETIDVGLCEGRYFLGEARVKNTIASITLDGRFSLTSTGGGSITVRNLYADAKDGALEVAVQPSIGRSRFRARIAQETKILMHQGEIVSQDPIDVQVDGHLLNGFRFQFGIAPRKLRVIAGRSRYLSPSDALLPVRTKSSTLASARKS
ncbi:MAG: hypothetical protein AAB879_01230 [Patescibacteria group bacterium]